MGRCLRRILLSLTLRTAPAVSGASYALMTANIYLFTCSGRMFCKRKITTLGNAAPLAEIQVVREQHAAFQAGFV